MKPNHWIGYSASDLEADVRRWAAKALDVPEKQVEILQTGGGWLARVRRKDE